jgi:hypothetical protein
MVGNSRKKEGQNNIGAEEKASTGRQHAATETIAEEKCTKSISSFPTVVKM